jgi:hypothetical protein
VVKRSTKNAAPIEEWETVTEVIRPSKFKHQRHYSGQKDERSRTTHRDAIAGKRSIPEQYKPGSDSGSTFADLLAASEKRKRERDKKKTSS